VSQLKCNPLHYAIATLTSATTFNQKKLVAKLLWLPFLGLLLHFFGVAVDRKSCSDVEGGDRYLLRQLPLVLLSSPLADAAPDDDPSPRRRGQSLP